MKKGTILLVEDEDNLREMLHAAMRSDYEISEARNGVEGIAAVKAHEFDAVVTDLLMPEVDGIELLREVKQISPQTDVIIMTAFGNVRSAVEAMRIGAFDYLTKPFDVDELKMILQKAGALRRMHREIEHLRSELTTKYEFDSIVGKSLEMQSVFGFIRRTLSSNYPLLVTGESGTGKELIARIYHYNGPRRECPFLAINCSTLSAELIESELFGHVKGAFSGAVRDKEGLFEVADGGTLFLDEIGDMSANLQARLLRVLQDGMVRRVGATRSTAVDVRIISATNRDLEEDVEEGRFRSDLFYRLNVVNIALPPLRRREGDIPLLVTHFLHNSEGKVKEVAPEAMEALVSYQWPGNVRELENAIKLSCLLAPGEILRLDDLPERVRQARRGPAPAISLQPLSSVISGHIEEILRVADGNISEAARILDLPRSTLRNKMKAYGLSDQREDCERS